MEIEAKGLKSKIVELEQEVEKLRSQGKYEGGGEEEVMMVKADEIKLN